MVSPKITFIFSFVSIVFVVSSCFKREAYPIEPIISEPTVKVLGDSALLTFAFTDGDGDIGLTPNEIDAPYDSASYYHYNLYLDYYEKDDNNGWQQGKDLAGNPIVFKYRLNPIIVKGKAVGIKGTMDVYMTTFRNPFSDQSDTIKYVIKLIDKALHESNELESDEIYL